MESDFQKVGSASSDDGVVSRPASAPSSRGRVGAFLAWTLAIFGTTAAVLGMMSVVSSLVVVFIVDLADAGVVSLDEIGPFAMDIGMLASQLSIIAIALPWWRHLRTRSLVVAGRPARPPRSAADTARTWASLLLLGLGLQVVISLALTFVSLFAPVLIEDYNDLMETAGVGVLTPLNILTTAILAPLSEEIACRGILLEYGLRAVCPSWSSRAGARGVPVSATVFLAGNALQAAAFGVMHLNIVQGSYAFVLGLVLGWVYWKTGKLRYAVGLHLAVNASSFLIDPLFEFVAPLPEAVEAALFLVIGLASLAGGALLFARVWRSGTPDAPAMPGGGDGPVSISNADASVLASHVRLQGPVAPSPASRSAAERVASSDAPAPAGAPASDVPAPSNPAVPASPVPSFDGASTDEQPAPVACNEDVLDPE